MYEKRLKMITNGILLLY